MKCNLKKNKKKTKKINRQEMEEKSWVKMSNLIYKT